MIMNAIKIAERLKSDAVYLRNELEGSVLRSVPGKAEFFARFSGKPEYPIHFSTKMVTDALTAWDEITKQQYERF